MPVDGDSGHLLRVAGGQPRVAADVARLSADRVDAADDHVVDHAGIDVDTLEQPAKRVHSQVDWVHLGQAAVALADRGTHGVDDVGLGHVELL